MAEDAANFSGLVVVVYIGSNQEDFCADSAAIVLPKAHLFKDFGSDSIPL
jgi:hypothetical protein